MSRSGHILLDATAARPPLTGVGWSMVELTAAMAAIATPGLRFTVLVEEATPFAALADRPGWALAPLRLGEGRLGRIRRSQTAVAAAARELGADLIHSLTMPGLLAPPCPSVVTVHDIAYRRVPETIETPRRLWYRFAVPRALGRAARVLTNSRTTADELGAAHPELKPRIRPTLFGTPAWVQGREPAGELPAPGAPFLFVGAVEPRKNLLGMLAALDLVRANPPAGVAAPTLHVVGAPGWRNREILQALASAQERSAVVLEGPRNRTDLWQRFTSARALLLPSLHEGFGFPILEGMAAGIPVITSNRGAMSETAGKAALLVDPEDPGSIAQAMIRILSEPELTRELRERGQRRWRELDWNRTARATLSVYQEVLG